MSVSFFWRRASAEVAATWSPAKLREHVPYWHERPDLWHAGLVMGAEHECSLLHDVLLACCPEGTPGADLAVFGGEPRRDVWVTPDGETEEYTVVTVLAPDEVATVARFLADTDYAAWIRGNPARMRELVEAPGSAGRWHDDRAKHLIEKLEDLADFHGEAAQQGDAVIKLLVC